MSNSWEDLLILPLFAIKWALVKIISFLPFRFLRRKCSYFLKYSKKLFFFEMVSVSPCFLVVLSSSLNYSINHSLTTFFEKLNLSGIIVLPIFFILTPFIILIYSQPKIRKKINLEKEKKKTEEQSTP